MYFSGVFQLQEASPQGQGVKKPFWAWAVCLGLVFICSKVFDDFQVGAKHLVDEARIYIGFRKVPGASSAFSKARSFSKAIVSCHLELAISKTYEPKAAHACKHGPANGELEQPNMHQKEAVENKIKINKIIKKQINKQINKKSIKKQLI